MRLFHLLLLLGTALTILTQHTIVAEHWAVIIAGSKGYENYRHQADACHAYHVVRHHGIPAENIIVMMYDDIANASENKFPGQIFNRPSSNASTALEVYQDCHIDYRQDDVTPEMFMNVLLGNIHATNGKKVLNSTSNDRVFINFVDHGARGFIMFPKGQMFTSNQLSNTLYSMYHQKKYKELVFYVEACHAGSMFYSWSMSHINAFVTTASNGWESSWGTYCPPHDIVNGVMMDTCLGDLYSVNWMEDSDRTDLSKETIEQQFAWTKAKTSKSHVEKYGSTHIRHEIVGNYQSNYDQVATKTDSDGQAPASDTRPDSAASAVNAHDISAVLAFYKYLRAPVGQDRTQLADELIQVIQARERADRVFEGIKMEYMQTYQQPLQQTSIVASKNERLEDCELNVFDVFRTNCPLPEDPDVQHGFNSYSLQYAGILFDLCHTIGNLSDVKSLLSRSCSGMKINQINDLQSLA